MEVKQKRGARMREVKGKYRMIVVACCGLIAATLGLITNISGLFFTPMAEEFGTGIGNVSMTLTISNLMYAFGGMAASRFFRRCNMKRIVVPCSLISMGATAALALARGLPILYLCSAIRGFFAGTIGMVLVTTLINNWFYARAGLMTSIAMGCSGLVGALASPPLAALIARAGWRVGYLAVALGMLLFCLPAILLPIRLKPEEMGMKPLGLTTKAADDPDPDSSAAVPVSGVLFALALVYGVIASFITSYPQLFPSLAASYRLTVGIGSGMVSACMVANTAGKLIFGVLGDHIGAKKSILVFGACVMTALVLMLLVPAPIVLLGAAALFGLSYSLATVGVVLATREIFGVQNYGRVYPAVSLGTTVANALGASALGFLYDATGAHTAALALLLGLSLAIMLLVVLAYRLRGRQQIDP